MVTLRVLVGVFCVFVLGYGKLSGLESAVMQAGDCSKKVEKGSRVVVSYKGSLLETGVEFDKGDGFRVTVGEGRVIKGWDDGLLGMCVGEKRELKIPASLGYGEAGAGSVIPPHSDLKFEIHLEGIEDGNDYDEDDDHHHDYDHEEDENYDDEEYEEYDDDDL